MGTTVSASEMNTLKSNMNTMLSKRGNPLQQIKMR